MLSDPALAVLAALRTATDPTRPGSSHDELLAAAQAAHAALPVAEQAPAVEQALAFLATRRTPASRHNQLDRLLPFLERQRPDDLRVALAALQPGELDGLPGTGGTAPLYSSLRSLWRQLAPGESRPAGLAVYGKRARLPYRLVGTHEFERVLADLNGSAADRLWAVLAVSLRLRLIESPARLRLGDVWLCSSRVVVFVWGKGDKLRTVSAELPPAWRAMLAAYLAARQAAGAVPSDPFFNPADMPPGQATENQLRRALDAACPGLTPHGLRRLGANRARAAGEPLLEGIGVLGHTSLTSASQSYLTTLPLLQAECLAARYAASAPAAMAAGMTANSLARVQGISREAVRQQRAAAGQANGRLTLAEAHALVLARIRAGAGWDKLSQVETDAEARAGVSDCLTAYQDACEISTPPTGEQS